MENNFVSQEEALTWASVGERIENRVHSVLYNMCMIESGRTYNGSIESFNIENGTVFVTTEDSCCGSRDYDYYKFPVAYLADDNWYGQYALEVKAKKEKDEQARLAKLAQNEKDKEEKERQEFERLKAKFS